jgi:hypothetical protein
MKGASTTSLCVSSPSARAQNSLAAFIGKQGSSLSLMAKIKVKCGTKAAARMAGLRAECQSQVGAML